MQTSICILDLCAAFFPVLSKKVGLASFGWFESVVSVDATDAVSSSFDEPSPAFFDLIGSQQSVRMANEK